MDSFEKRSINLMGWFWSFTLCLQTYKDIQQDENMLHQATCLNWSMPASHWKYFLNSKELGKYLSCLCVKVDGNVDTDTIPDGIGRHQPQPTIKRRLDLWGWLLWDQELVKNRIKFRNRLISTFCSPLGLICRTKCLKYLKKKKTT